MKTLTLSFIAGGALLVSCSPTAYKVDREIEIDAPAAVVFEQVNVMKNRDAWSPWEQKDPNMTKEYAGTESGVGAKYMWSGNDSVGTGNMEILESKPNEYIKSKLVFTEPWESESIIEWSFEETQNGTKATWSVSGELPGYLFWMGQDDMDENMGPDFEKGLAQLKSVSEQIAGESKNDWSAEFVEVSPHDYFHITDEVSFDEMDNTFFGERFGKLVNYLGSDAQNMTMPPFAIYHSWDEESRMTKVSAAIACHSDKKGNDEIGEGVTHEGKALKCLYYGPYEDMEGVHNFMHAHIESQNMQIVGSPWEVYITDPETEPDPSKWLTEVYYPVGPKDEKSI
ncbi:MAG: SRPBCC family protein [Flavobacteriales bacterium]|nr:SRPBCC family protein [Flavobacteriales bacterium]